MKHWRAEVWVLHCAGDCFHLFKAGKTNINSAADAAAGLLFSLGVIGVGFLAVAVMTGGAAYDLCQTVGWEYGLNKKPRQEKRFYGAIAAFTLVAVAINFWESIQ